MAPKSRLRQAIAAEKGIDFQKLKQHKKAKEASKTQNRAGGANVEQDDEQSGSEGEDYEQVCGCAHFYVK